MTVPDILTRTPDLLRAILAPATEDDLRWQPRPDRWSISMVLAHLADVEVKGFMSRFRPMVEQENPFLPYYDQLAPFRNRNDLDGRAELEQFARRRSETLTWLAAVPPAAFARTGRHEQLGIITIGQLLSEFAFHDLGHIRQIVELYRSHAYYPEMGAFQQYYKINP